MAPGHHHVDKIFGDFLFQHEHFEYVMAEDLLQLLCLKTRRNREHPVSMEAAIRGENVKMGIVSKKITEGLYGNNGSRNSVVLGHRFLEKDLQRFPSTTT